MKKTREVTITTLTWMGLQKTRVTAMIVIPMNFPGRFGLKMQMVMDIPTGTSRNHANGRRATSSHQNSNRPNLTAMMMTQTAHGINLKSVMTQ